MTEPTRRGSTSAWSAVIAGVALMAVGSGLLTACATSASGIGASALSPSPSVTTLMIGWESRFRVEWNIVPGDGSRHIEGRVVNTYGRGASDLRLLVQAFDSAGGLVGQRIAWVEGGVPAMGRAFFRIAPVPAADHYSVTVWDYTIQKRG